jgi:hypothetical protein
MLPDTQKYQSALEILSIERFRSRTTSTEKVTSVPVTRINLIPNNPNRLHYLLINEGSFDVRVSNDPNITASTGWMLSASGGIISMDWEQDGETVGQILYAIAVTGSSDVRSREIIIL